MSHMKLTKISPTLERSLHNLLKQYDITDCLEHVYNAGGRVFLVGGAVRDLILGRQVHDVDFEVHGMTLDALESVLRICGPVSLVGKAFGVLRIAHVDIDWSVPRTDSAGRKPKVTFDEHMDPVDAFKRRDLTMNAMGIDVRTMELFDPFDGQKALEEKRLSTPDVGLFIEDPLRFYRVMHSIGRFEMYPDQQLNAVCRTMDISHISKERIAAEFEKLMLLSKRPSLGFRWLKEIGRLSQILPELAATYNIPQDPEWHPEGDVFEHTMQSLDAAAALPYDSAAQALKIIWGSLCHDLGKVSTTHMINGRITSYDHERAGIEPTRALLRRVVMPHDLIDAVCLLVLHHMAPVQLPKQGASPSAYKRLAMKLYPLITMQELAMLSLADKRGRNPQGHEPLTISVAHIEEFIKRAERVKVLNKPESSIIQGKDLLAYIAPGPLLGKVLERIYEIQIDEGILDKEELIKRARDYARSLSKQ